MKIPQGDYQLLRPIADAIDSHPDPAVRRKATDHFARLNQSLVRRRSVLSMIQETFTQLRLDMKYLIFDLEATRRERDELRERLGE